MRRGTSPFAVFGGFYVCGSFDWGGSWPACARPWRLPEQVHPVSIVSQRHECRMIRTCANFVKMNKKPPGRMARRLMTRGSVGRAPSVGTGRGPGRRRAIIRIRWRRSVHRLRHSVRLHGGCVGRVGRRRVRGPGRLLGLGRLLHGRGRVWCVRRGLRALRRSGRLMP